jgi:hypothetical protein
MPIRSTSSLATLLPCMTMFRDFSHADILITETEVLTWYHCLAQERFAPARWVPKPFDEEKGPQLVFADGTQSI